MLVLVVADNRTVRTKHLAQCIPAGSEILPYDDTYGSVLDLEQYLYPSLFTLTPPVIHVKFMLESAAMSTDLMKKMIASPSVFVFEELALPTSLITAFKKAGALVHLAEKSPKTAKANDLFGATLAITAKDKKSRWMAYQSALAHHPVEAIIGILYWKIRDLISKNPKEKQSHLALYTALIEAHARAWQTGTPLALAIEKVLLTQ